MKKLLLLSLILIATVASGEVKSITPAQLSTMQKKGVPVIDIRTAGEWRQSGIIPHSYTITFFDERGRYDLRDFLRRLKVLGVDTKKPFILVCRTSHRTRLIGRYLSEKLGYEKVYHLEGGILKWLAQKRPIVPYKAP